MYLARYAILLDGGFVTKKLQQKHKRPATADDILALCVEIRNHDELKHYELLRTYFYDAPPSQERLAYPVSGSQYHLGKTDRAKHAQSLYDQLEPDPKLS